MSENPKEPRGLQVGFVLIERVRTPLNPDCMFLLMQHTSVRCLVAERVWWLIIPMAGDRPREGKGFAQGHTARGGAGRKAGAHSSQPGAVETDVMLCSGQFCGLRSLKQGWGNLWGCLVWGGVIV